MTERLDDQQRADKERASFDAAFIRAIDRQAEMVAHTPGWKPLIDLVWEELAVTRSAGTRTEWPLDTLCGLACDDLFKAYGIDFPRTHSDLRRCFAVAEKHLRTLQSASERISEYTGFAVVMDDPNSAPEGFWWVGAWHHKATADEIAKKHGAASHVVQISSVAQRIGVKPISRLSCACEVNEDDTFIEKCALHSDWLKALLDIALCRMNKEGRRGAVTMEVFGPWARQRAAEVIPEDEYKLAVEALNGKENATDATTDSRAQGNPASTRANK